jgi:hypothetical protein
MHEKRDRSGADLHRRVEGAERRLVEVLRASRSADGSPADIDGLIGARAGVRVKLLPSTIYWNGLTRLGILTAPLAADELQPSTIVDVLDPGAADERSTRPSTNWHPTIPAPPDGFPDEVTGGFTMRPDEAAWLRDVVIEGAPGTLLAHLVARPGPPEAGAAAPWDEPAAYTADDEIRALLEEARLFSFVFEGAALLYNLLLARAYEAHRFTRVVDTVERYEREIDRWASEVEAERGALQVWDLVTWWATMRSFNNRIGPATHQFATAWIERVRPVPARQLAGDRAAERLIANRERVLKRTQARLVNERLLGNWNGASGIGRLTFRWPNVHRIVTDIVAPLSRADAGT